MDQSLVVTIEMSLYNTVGTSSQYSLIMIGFMIVYALKTAKQFLKKYK